MLLTPHILSGMVFGSFSQNPFLASFLGILSYFILEMIPHWDPENRNKKIVHIIRIADLWIGVISFFVIIITLNPAKIDSSYILGGIFAALCYLLFSILHLFPHQNEILKKLHKYRLGIKYTDRSWWGLFIQISICVLAIAILYRLIDFPTWDKLLRSF